MAWRLLSCIENQFNRRNLSKYDRGVLALQLESLYAAEAKRRHDANGGDKRSDDYQKSASQKSDAPKIRTDEQIAKLAGMSRDTIRKVKVIETEAAKKTAPHGGRRMGRSLRHRSGQHHTPASSNYNCNTWYNVSHKKSLC